MLHIHFSNRLEPLRAQLLQRLGHSDAGVFTAEQVIVPHAAMRRALSLAIADAAGICANVHFAFLASWLWQQIARVVAGVADSSPFAAGRLAWRVYRVFGDADFVAGHPRLAAYLHGADPVMRHELAGRVAALLELYVTYRPDWLRAWREGHAAELGASDRRDESWQAALWQRIEAELGAQARHPAQAFVEALQHGGSALAQRAGLPACAHVFALPGMAPLHLQLLQQMSPWVELHLYVLNPCREYWFELVDRRRLSWLAARRRDQGHEEGNRLLASWGRSTQVHVEALVELCGEAAQDDAQFHVAGDSTLLQQLQDAVLALRPIEPASIRLDADDRSLELHVCHSLTRELEVLQDHLLGLFERVPGLQPADILVVTPDLDRAAPLIDAIFGTAPAERHIAYAVAGRARSGQNLPARALLSLLALAASRCSASTLFAVLEQPIVARRFGLDDAALGQVHEWLRVSGFHWGLDAGHLAEQGLPDTPRHTLDDALQRLFLGHALPSMHDTPFEGLLGAGDAEGTDALALGAFWRFAAELQRLQRELRQPLAPAAWAAALLDVLDRFTLAAQDELDDRRELQDGIRQLVDDMRSAGVGEPLPLAVVRGALQQLLDDPARSGAAGGSLTFASMSSHRGLPRAVVCAIGLNDGAFPSVTAPLEFDLLALHPRRGDRRRRDDERGLMLDLLLAARHSLYLSHSGRSVRDNSPLPPSVLVAELLDLLLPAIAGDPLSPQALQAARARLVVEHPLQPFAPQAFAAAGDARLRSHHREFADALRHGLLAAPAGSAAGTAAAARVFDDDLAVDDEETTDADAGAATAGAAATGTPPTPFFARALPAPEAGWRQVTMAQLVEFFRNPARYLLRRRLGVELPWAADELQDDEPFVPDRRTRAALAGRLLPPLLDRAGAPVLQLARAVPELPEGALGERQLQLELQRLRQFAATLREARAAACLAPHSRTLALSLDDEDWTLQVAFAELRPAGLLRWRYAESSAGDYLEGWLQHLALCAAGPAQAAPRTRWLSADGEFAYRPCADAARQLGALLRLYRRGLREPLHFYARSAWQLRLQGRSQALAAWRATPERPHGEEADPAYRLALRGVDEPLDDDFESLAATVLDPLLQHLDDPRLPA